MDPPPADWEEKLVADMEARERRGRMTRLVLLALTLGGFALGLLLKRWGWAG